MKKRLSHNAAKYIMPVVASGFIYFLTLPLDLGEKHTNKPIHKPEPHWEVSPTDDYYGLNRDNSTAAVTGTMKVMTYGENSSIEDSY